MSESEKITIEEFQTWLKGAEEFQPQDWIPDAKQWALIRKKIDNLTSNKNTLSNVNTTSSTLIQPQPTPVLPSSFEPPPVPQEPQPTYKRYPKEQAVVSPGARQTPPPTTMVPKTSGLEPSDSKPGEYESSFI